MINKEHIRIKDIVVGWLKWRREGDDMVKWCAIKNEMRIMSCSEVKNFLPNQRRHNCKQVYSSFMSSFFFSSSVYLYNSSVFFVY